jgi:hypothetical protein
MQDYGLIGLHSMEDRKSIYFLLIKEMFQLIQTLKNSDTIQVPKSPGKLI